LHSNIIVLLSLFLIGAGKAYSIDIIAHRGASGYLPEHTKEALILAYMQGADYIEQDLVLSKDDELIVLHDIHLAATTNVEAIYPNRKRNDGRYYVIDFTLDELRQLSIHERQNQSNVLVYPNRYRGTAHFSITTFDEQIELIQELNRRFNRDTGWYPEIKSPEWHLSEGKDITKVLIDKLNQHQLNTASTKMFVQSFDPVSLQRLKNDLGAKIALIQLIAENAWNTSSADYTVMQTRAGMQQVSLYADGIAPWLPQLIALNTTYQLNTDLLKNAKEAGLVIHPYTLREDVLYEAGLSIEKLYEGLVLAKVDGVFTDHILPFMKN